MFRGKNRGKASSYAEAPTLEDPPRNDDASRAYPHQQSHPYYSFLSRHRQLNEDVFETKDYPHPRTCVRALVSEFL